MLQAVKSELYFQKVKNYFIIEKAKFLFLEVACIFITKVMFFHKRFRAVWEISVILGIAFEV